MLVAPVLLGLSACRFASAPCSCGPMPPIATSADAAGVVSGAAAVFEGTVVRAPAESRGSRYHVFTFVVHRRWKGDVGDTVAVQTPPYGTMCRANFVEGQTYVVFTGALSFRNGELIANASPDDHLFTTKCSPSFRRDSDRGRIATLLGSPLPPISGSRPRGAR